MDGIDGEEVSHFASSYKPIVRLTVFFYMGIFLSSFRDYMDFQGKKEKKVIQDLR